MQQLSSLIDFSQLKSQKDTANAFKKALEYINYTQNGEPDKEVVKNRSSQFLKLINYHLYSEASPVSKFYTLSILKITTEKDKRNILSVLSGHSLFRYLVAMAKSTDPELPIEQKGKRLFPDPKIGNDFIRLILESLKVWGERFSSNKKMEISHFKKAYDELIKMGVVTPKQFVFYDRKMFLPAKGNDRLTEIAEATISQKMSRMVTEQPLKQAQSQNIKIMQYDIKKIEEFIKKLQQKEYQKYCHEYHRLFQKQKQKYEPIINNLITSNKQKQLHTALAINEFYVQQSQAYQKFLAHNNDYYSYVNLIQLKVDDLISSTRKTPQVKEVVKQTVKESVKKEVTIQVQKVRTNNFVSNINPNPNSESDNKALVSKLKSQLNQKPQLQATSFKNIKQSLSKDKTFSRARRSVSGLKKSSVSKFSKSITKSRISQIFFHPPNPYPQDKRYQGQKIPMNRDLERAMKQISKHQGHRRFVTSNFKNKNPLFQNNHIQIGFKSETIYEEVNEFWVILSIELFIGNKTENTISNFSIDYKGQTNMLLYGNPKNVQNYLSPGVQTKQQLLIAPLDNKPSLIKMYMRYQVNGESHEQKIILPNSIIKFVQNGKLSKKQFVQHWNGSTIYKTEEFKLTRYIAPDSLGKYIGILEELSSYDRFVETGSETDYELGCEVILKKKYEGVLRISIRPNLNAVIQIGITTNDNEAYEGFIYYAQTLQMILSSVQTV